MVDRIVMISENNRFSSRGISQLSASEYMAYQRDDDVLDYTMDYSSWLGTDTITGTPTREASGTVVTSPTNTTTQVVQKLSGSGYVDIKIVTTAGRTKQDRICIEPRSPDRLYRANDYR